MSTPLPLIYIAGPFRGSTPYMVRKNVERARDLGFVVAHHGGYPIIPHTMTCDFDKLLTDQFWLDGTMELLRRCDAVLLEYRWTYSTGARAERDEAYRLKLPVFDANDDGWLDTFHAWLGAWQFNARHRAARTAAAAAGPGRGILQVPLEDPLAGQAGSPPTTAPAPASGASEPLPAPEIP